MVRQADVTSAISLPFSLALDMARILAAVVVVTGHAGQLGLFAGTWPLSQTVQHVAVIVFFVLSGLVIADSVMSRELSLQRYAIARFSRIFPVAVAGIVLGNLAWLAGIQWELKLPAQPPGFNVANIQSVVMPMLFLSETGAGTGPVMNPPYWSLCYEVFYYAIFAAIVFLKGRRRLAWTIALSALAGPRIIILAPVWLAGVWLQSYLSELRTSLRTGILLILVGGAAVILLASAAMTLSQIAASWTFLSAPVLRFSQYWLADWLMAPAVVAIFVGIRPLAERVGPTLERHAGLVRRLAGSSFTLYLIHWPIISLLVSVHYTTKNYLGLAGIIAAILVLAIAAAEVLERQITPALKRTLIDRLNEKAQNSRL